MGDTPPSLRSIDERVQSGSLPTNKGKVVSVLKTNVHVLTGKNATDEKVTDREEISIQFKYPLSDSVTFDFAHDGGFSLRQFTEVVREGYQRIYADATKYGVWGHTIGDLYIEGISEDAPGVFTLSMGS